MVFSLILFLFSFASAWYFYRRGYRAGQLQGAAGVYYKMSANALYGKFAHQFPDAPSQGHMIVHSMHSGMGITTEARCACGWEVHGGVENGIPIDVESIVQHHLKTGRV